MTQASLQTYKELIKEGKLKNDQEELIKLIAVNPGFTIPEMEAALNKRRNEFSGRLSELRSQGIIYTNGKKGAYSKYYYEPSVLARFQIRDQYEDEVFVKWLKKGQRFEKKLTGDTMNELKETLKIQVQKVKKIA